MKNGLLRTLAASLAALTAAGCAMFSSAADGGLTDGVSVTYNGGDAVKEETVYVIANADGTADRIISSCHLKNPDGAETLSDVSNLEDIENVKSDGEYRRDGNNIVWDADGRDVYYRGNGTKALPVEISVSYTLDGKKVTADEIAGKSGKVTVRFDYKNNEYRTVTVDGEDEKIAVPFVVATGALLDNETFRNVEVTNGRAIDDGDRTAVIGFALPGISDDLDLAKSGVELPEYVEFSADAENFSLDMTLTVALNELFSGLELNGTEELGGLKDQMSKITDAMSLLISGSDKLYEGLNTLYGKTEELASGAGALNDGAAQIASGAKQVADGSSELSDGANKVSGGAAELNAGASALKSGLDELSKNNDALCGGALKVFNTLLSTATGELRASGVEVPDLTVENYSAVLDGVISSLDSNAVYDAALSAVTAAVNEKRDMIVAEVTSAVRANVRAAVIQKAANMTAEDFDAAVAAGLVDAETSSAVEGATDAQMQSAEVKALIDANVNDTVEKLIAENMAGDEVQSKLAAAAEGAKSVIALKASLDSYNAFYLGLKTYTAGVASAADGAAKLGEGASALASGAGELASGAAALKDGTSTLADGAEELHRGTSELAGNLPALIDGVKQLRDGAKTLSDGVKQFGAEAVDRIVEKLSGLDVVGLAERLEATKRAASEYGSYSGIADGAKGSVRFIWRTAAVKAENK